MRTRARRSEGRVKWAAPDGTPPGVERLLWHLPSDQMLRIRDQLTDAVHDHGLAVDIDDEPVFYETRVPLLGHDAALGALCATVWEHIRNEFDDCEAEPPANLHTAITIGAMTAGNYDQALAYLMSWVGIELED